LNIEVGLGTTNCDWCDLSECVHEPSEKHSRL